MYCSWDVNDHPSLLEVVWPSEFPSRPTISRPHSTGSTLLRSLLGPRTRPRVTIVSLLVSRVKRYPKYRYSSDMMQCARYNVGRIVFWTPGDTPSTVARRRYPGHLVDLVYDHVHLRTQEEVKCQTFTMSWLVAGGPCHQVVLALSAQRSSFSDLLKT